MGLSVNICLPEYTLINLNSRGPLFSLKSCHCLACLCSSASLRNIHKGIHYLFVREDKNKQILEIKLCKHSSNLNDKAAYGL